MDTFRRAAAHKDEEVREAENEQRRNRRSVLEYREQEQSVNTKRRVIARLDPEYRLVWATELSLAAIGLVFPVLVLGCKSFNCSMYQVPVPTLIEKFV